MIERQSKMFSVKDLESYVCKSSSALQLKFVRSQTDVLDDTLAFPTLYTHQVFGEKEVIFGYKNLKVKLFYTPDTLLTYLNLSYDEQIDPAKHDGTKADNVFKILSEYIPPGYVTNLDEYLKKLSQPSSSTFQPFGELLHVYHVDDREYEVYKASISCCGFPEYHERLQTFLLWFIENASFIDVDDDKWMFYLIYEKYHNNVQPCYAIIGYTTVYNFYHYPDKLRARISQMLVLPPFQRKGHGAQLLQTVYNDLRSNPQIVDITVEDPSDEFAALRDFVDCKDALQLECFQPPSVHRPFCEEIEAKCRQKLKLQKKQSRRVYEILRLKATDRSNQDQYKAYRLSVKNRLNGPSQRQKIDLKRLRRYVSPVQLFLTHPQLSRDEHMRQLHEEYEKLEKEYMEIIEKLSASRDT